MKLTRSYLHLFFSVLGFSLFLLISCSGGNDNSSSPIPQNKFQTDQNPPTEDAKSTNDVPITIDPSILGKHEQESCNPILEKEQYTRSDCEEGLVCTPDVYQKNKGFCRVPCSAGDKRRFLKNEEACPAGRSCQIVTSLNLYKVGAFCLPIQRERDGQCQAVLDNNSCTKNRKCMPTSIGKTNGEISAKSFICRDTCPYGSKDADQSCAIGEICMLSPDGKTGICGKEIPWARAADFSPNFSGQTCNENSDHRFCNKSLLTGLSDAATPTCISLSSTKESGLCFAFCSVPALDLNQDGQISEQEAKKTLACPAHFTCSTNLGRSIGLIRKIPSAQNPQEGKSCNPDLCKPGEPCPSQCGPGDAECLTFPSKDGTKTSFCGAPFGNCESSQT